MLRREEAPPALVLAQALPCAALLCCGTPEVDRATFRALNSNSIVYDGGLVIDRAPTEAALRTLAAVYVDASRYSCR